MRNFDQLLDRHGVGVDPGPLHVGEEHLRRPGDAEARVDAALRLELQLEVLPAHRLHAVRHRGCRGRRAGGAAACGRRRGGRCGGGGLVAARGTRRELRQLPRPRPRARASPAARSAAPAWASCAKRSMNRRRAAAPRHQRRGVAQRDERHSRVALRIRRPGRQARGALGERHQRLHQADRQVHRQRLLGRRRAQRVRVREQPQHQRVAGIGEVDGGEGRRILDPHPPLGPRRPAQHRVGGRRPRGRELRVASEQLLQLGAHAEELLVVRARRVARRALALLDDGGEGRERGLQADDRLHPGQVHLRGRQLQRRLAAEGGRLAVTLDEGAQPGAEVRVEIAHRVVVARHGRQVRPIGAAHVGPLAGKARALAARPSRAAARGTRSAAAWRRRTAPASR